MHVGCRYVGIPLRTTAATFIDHSGVSNALHCREKNPSKLCKKTLKRSKCQFIGFLDATKHVVSVSAALQPIETGVWRRVKRGRSRTRSRRCCLHVRIVCTSICLYTFYVIKRVRDRDQ